MKSDATALDDAITLLREFLADVPDAEPEDLRGYQALVALQDGIRTLREAKRVAEHRVYFCQEFHP